MFLHQFRIENFRAIRKAIINFDDGTALIGENDCGITSVLDALEMALGQEEGPKAVPANLFHHVTGAEGPNGPIRLQLRFRENQPGEWADKIFEAFADILPARGDRRRELWYEIRIRPANEEPSTPEFRLRSPGCKAKSSDPDLIRLIRQLNPAVRVSAGMLTGHGRPSLGKAEDNPDTRLLVPEIAAPLERINKAVYSRLSGCSLDLKANLADGLSAAWELIEMDTIKLGKRESGLSRTVSEIVGWSPSGAKQLGSTQLHSPNSAPEHLGILLLIGALLRARPAGIIPDADPLWIIEEPEAHLHPITLTSVAMFIGLIQRQRIITTYSGDLLSVIPLKLVRRLVRHEGVLYENRVRKNMLTRSELRRFQYHLRSRFGVASFARLWLLVEGESEFWLIPQIARLMGYEFSLEGIACVEFAQCGLDPLIKVARELGIEWHVLTDGDAAGEGYGNTVRGYLEKDNDVGRLTVLEENDIEHCFWQFGYADVYRKRSGFKGRQLREMSPTKIIQMAVRRQSKPFLALSIVEAIARKGSNSIPQALQEMVHACIDRARNAQTRLSG